MAGSASTLDRVLLHLKGNRWLAVDPADIYYLEADGDETIIRRRGRRVLRDVRSLGEVIAAIKHCHFHRIHDKWAVNLQRVHEIRRRRVGRDWEVAMRPPVNHVLPVSTRRLQGLLRRFEG